MTSVDNFEKYNCQCKSALMESQVLLSITILFVVLSGAIIYQTTNKSKDNKRIVSTASNTSNSEGILYTDADSAHYPFFSSFNFALLQNFRIITRFTSTVLCT